MTTPAYLGAMSMWFTLKPPRAKPRQPSVSVTAHTPLHTPGAAGMSMSAIAEVTKPVGSVRFGWRSEMRWGLSDDGQSGSRVRQEAGNEGSRGDSDIGRQLTTQRHRNKHTTDYYARAQITHAQHNRGGTPSVLLTAL